MKFQQAMADTIFHTLGDTPRLTKRGKAGVEAHRIGKNLK